jgi:hypothetical protein
VRRTVLLALAALAACPKNGTSIAPTPHEDASAESSSPVDALAYASAAGADAGPVDAGPPPIDASDDPADLAKRTGAELLELVPLDGGSKYLSFLLAPAVGKTNQGNPDIARHTISKKKCLEGLRGIVIQTDEQRAICGAENMVPIYKGADPATAKTCIDVFEFPNQACELPFVWISPQAAERVCELEGKRLCAQEEWNLACRGDPAGGKDRAYAYGDALDLEVCNTNKPHQMAPDGRNWVCWVKDAYTAFKTCSTDTEPAGAFPQCRSRFGVFDQHGNVAEIMTRKQDDVVYTQLKGSAFFYVDVSRSHKAPPGMKPAVDGGTLHDTYPDHCNYDPRWHVEKLDEAMHTNYHLGFRCCKTIKPPSR